MDTNIRRSELGGVDSPKKRRTICFVGDFGLEFTVVWLIQHAYDFQIQSVVELHCVVLALQQSCITRYVVDLYGGEYSHSGEFVDHQVMHFLIVKVPFLHVHVSVEGRQT